MTSRRACSKNRDSWIESKGGVHPSNKRVIAIIRRIMKWSKDEMAQKCNLNPKYITQLVAGKEEMNQIVAEKIASGMGVSREAVMSMFGMNLKDD